MAKDWTVLRISSVLDFRQLHEGITGTDMEEQMERELQGFNVRIESQAAVLASD